MKGYYSEFDEYFNDSIARNPVGRGLSVVKPVDRLGRENYITGNKKIFQCIRDILDTPKGSRFMYPSYGSNLYRVLEEPNDLILIDMAELFIKEALQEWEPRIVVDGVVCEATDSVLSARIDFHMKNSNEVDSYVYSANRRVPEMR